jgi:hypothetical protein
MNETVTIFVVPGAGRKVPLPVPGGRSVPAAGTYVTKTLAVTRLLRTGDLVETTAPEKAEPVTRSTAKADVRTAAEVTSVGVTSGATLTVAGAATISGATMSALHEVASAVVSGGITSGGSAVAKESK